MPLFQFGFILGDSTNVAVATESAALLLMKVLFLVAGFIYLSFGVIVTRQVAIMKKTLITQISPLIDILGYVHLFVAFAIFLFFLTL